MCNVPVALPTLASFLMLYSLKCGCIVIFAWTLFRSLFYIVFFMVTIILMYMPDSEHTDSVPAADSFVFVFPSYITLIVIECFIFTFSFYLGAGLYCESIFQLQQFLICRFFAFIFEVIALLFLCYNHYYYIGWYLVFLMIIILEAYSFIVVYSYYVELIEEAKECEDTELECEDTEPNCDSDLNESMRGMPCTRVSRYMPAPRDAGEMCNMKDVRGGGCRQSRCKKFKIRS